VDLTRYRVAPTLLPISLLLIFPLFFMLFCRTLSPSPLRDEFYFFSRQLGLDIKRSPFSFRAFPLASCLNSHSHPPPGNSLSLLDVASAFCTPPFTCSFDDPCPLRDSNRSRSFLFPLEGQGPWRFPFAAILPFFLGPCPSFFADFAGVRPFPIMARRIRFLFLPLRFLFPFLSPHSFGKRRACLLSQGLLLFVLPTYPIF